MPGLHHVTAIAGNALKNFDFYTRALGLRFVKKTVNFDDPGTYHFYYGDEAGHPGTILTFFPWENAGAGRGGVGQTQQTAFRVPARSLGYWTHRFIEKGIAHETLEKRFGEAVLPFTDADGMSLALVGIAGAEDEPGWSNGEVPQEHAIRGFHGVTLLLDSAAKTSAILIDVLGFKETAREGSIIRLSAGNSAGGIVDIYEAKGFLPGRQGRGSVHHVAFRAADDADQAEMARKLAQNHGMHPTEQKDRNYFRSVYFREPGGILFEIATDIPGFAVDEPVESLGEHLKLPKFLEPHRKEIENVLPSLEKGCVMTDDLSFIHRFEPGSRREAAPLLLLHGTGGDENDLLPLGQSVAPGAALLSVRGQVREQGMSRFFRRFAEGVFDEDDVRRRAGELADFVAAARRRYDLAAPVALGYSNGANIAAAMLLLRPQVLAGAMLLRAMVPLSRPPQADLAGKPILIISGEHDPIIPASNAAELAAQLAKAGANVQHRILPVGHQLSQADLTIAREWIAAIRLAQVNTAPAP